MYICGHFLQSFDKKYWKKCKENAPRTVKFWKIVKNVEKFCSWWYQGGGYLLGCRSSIVFDGTGIQKIRRRISFVPSDYRSIDLHALRQACVLQSIYIGKEWNSMVFLNFLPEVIPGHYNFGMNRQEILREIHLWHSKRAVFSPFWDIWLLSKKPLRRRVCNTQLA